MYKFFFLLWGSVGLLQGWAVWRRELMRGGVAPWLSARVLPPRALAALDYLDRELVRSTSRGLFSLALRVGIN